MTSLDDLRATLQGHASDVADTDVAVRAASVHTRVGVVRRRRRAAVGAAAAVLVVAGGVALLPGGDETVAPEPSTDDVVVGVDVPPTMDSLGFTYELAQSIEGSLGRVKVALPASSEPRLVSWATAGDDQDVTVEAPTLPGPTAYDVPDFGDFTYVPAGSRAAVQVVADRGEPGLGLAVYTLTDERPPGITKDGVTFREDVAGLTLLGAAIGDLGQAEVSYEATATSRGIELPYFCSSEAPNAYLHIAIGGEDDQVFGRVCHDAVPVDPASLGGSGFTSTPGEDVGIRFYVTEGRNGRALDDPSLRIGIGTYAVANDEEATGMEGYFPVLREEGGHTWRLVERSTVGDPGDARISATAPSDRGAMLAVLGLDQRGSGSSMVDWDGNSGSTVLGGTSSQSTWDTVAAGGTVTLDFTRGAGGRSGDDDVLADGSRVDIAFYERVD